MKTNHTIKITLAGVAIFAALLGDFCEADTPASDLPNAKLQTVAATFRASTTGTGLQIAVSNCGKVLSSPDGICWAKLDEINRSVPTFFRGVTHANGIFVIVGGSYLGVPGVILTSKNGKDWTSRPSGTRNNLYGVTFGDGQFVAVGDHDTILTSTDGVHWRTRVPRTTDIQFASVAFGNGTFVAVGDSGAILTSPDGENWTARNSGTSTYLKRVAFEQGRFVVTAANGIALASDDGLVWAIPDPAQDLVAGE